MYNQRKRLLFIDGGVKSGKTTILPFLLQDSIIKEDFRFAYIDLSPVNGVPLEEKWKYMYNKLKIMFKDWVEEERTDMYSLKDWIQSALQKLNSELKWIITLDECQFFFSGLKDNEVATMAEQVKMLLLDNVRWRYIVSLGSNLLTLRQSWVFLKYAAISNRTKQVSMWLITGHSKSPREAYELMVDSKLQVPPPFLLFPSFLAYSR